MKTRLHLLLKYLPALFFRQLFKISLRKSRPQQAIWICDIDNTIADTWRFFYVENGKPKAEKYLLLPILKGMSQQVFDQQHTNKIVFLTAREFRRFFLTRRWLRQNGFIVRWHNVILVSRMRDKLPLLAAVAKRFPNQITYFDDLSFNHQNGDIKFYDDVINGLQKLPIRYVGYDELLKINELDK